MATNDNERDDELPAVDGMYRPFWQGPMRALCVKDGPPQIGFGRILKAGDVIEVDGVIWRDYRYQLCCRPECGFYDMVGYFKPMEVAK